MWKIDLQTKLVIEGVKLKCSYKFCSRAVRVISLLLALTIAIAGSGSLAGNEQSISVPIPMLPELAQTPQTIEKVLQLEAEGQKLFQKGEMDKALIKIQESYGLSLEMKYSEGEGRALTAMSELYLTRGQTVKAKELGENAVELLSESSDKKSLGRARVALAQCYFALDNPAWAANQLEQALKSFTQFGVNDSAEAARVMLISGSVLIKMGKVKEAIRFYQGACSYYEQAGNHDMSITTRINLASIMRELGWHVAGLEEAQKALEEARQSKGNALVPAALATVAIAQYNLGEFANARRSYEELLYLKSSNDLAIARLQCGYGHTLAGTGDLDAAKTEIEMALKILKAKGTPIEQAQALNTLACLEEAQGHRAKAVQLFTQALEVVALVQPKQDNFVMVMLQNLSAAESRSGDYRNAKGHLLSCFPLLKKVKDLFMEGRVYAALGEVCLALQDGPEAEKYLRAGITVSEKVNDDAALWRNYTNLAVLQLSVGQVAAAKESLSSALSYFRSPQAGYFPSPERLGFPTSRQDLGEKLVSLMVSHGQLDTALLAAEQLKDESFIIEWLHHGGDVKQFDRDAYNDLVNQRAHLHAAESSSSPDKMTKDWQAWLTRFRQLVSSNRALARLIAPLPVSSGEVMKGIQASHAVVIDYLVGGHSTTVFTIDNSGRLGASTLPVGREELQPQVSSLLVGAEAAEARVDRHTLLQLFHELFPDQVKAVLPTNPDQTVVILPDGVLYNLPFAALLDASGKYLVENHTLTLAPSLSAFCESPPPYSHDVSVLVAGEPNGSAGQNANSETDQITSLFQPDLVMNLSGKDAEINNLEEQVKGKAILHFASKQPLFDGNPQRAVLPILAGGKDSKEKITADRLFSLNLPSDLVIWSGTYVNSQDRDGNALKVFSRGLSYAGVRNVLMSLWVEPDAQRTSQLVDFYKGSQKGLNQAQSLRKAQLLALSKDPSPRLWAAFQLLGPGH